MSDLVSASTQIVEVVSQIEDGGILPPLVVLQLLAKNKSIKVRARIQKSESNDILPPLVVLLLLAKNKSTKVRA